MKSASEKGARTSRNPSPTAAKAKEKAESAREADVLSPSTSHQWTFLTNHAHVLVLLSQHPSLVLREVALQVGITERAVQRIIADLEAEGIIEREKVGRQNRYRIKADRPLRHPIEAHRTISDLLALCKVE